ncbi:MAG: response regulator [bacterium]|nr:response regulator [bacterium]
MSLEAIVAVVDDDPSVRRALGRLLCSAGFEVELYGSSEELLERKDLVHLGCLILDVHLPGMSGLDLQARLLSEHRACPILFITAFDDRAAEKQAMQAGALAFLNKPLNTGYLLQLIEGAMH